MRSLSLSRDAQKFLTGLDPKFFKQVAVKIFSLTHDSPPADSKTLQGYDDLLRVDQGEFRIIYRISETLVEVILIGKRNDDEVYKRLSRKT